MRIAYVISAYKLPEQLERLVRRLHTGSDTGFVVHVDRKTDGATYREMQERLHEPDVAFVDRHACHWGGFGHVRATLKGLEEIRARGWNPEHVILLSGQDYPIKPNEYIRDFLERGAGRSFFLHFPLPTASWTNGGLDRIRRWHWRYRRLHLSVPLRRRLPGGLRPWGGSAYWILARDAVRSVSQFVEENPDYVRFFRHVDIPDELFFATLLLNSAEAGRCENVRLHYTEWSRSPAPAILTTEDYPHLADSACLFARKFDPRVDAAILGLIDERLLVPVGSPR